MTIPLPREDRPPSTILRLRTLHGAHSRTHRVMKEVRLRKEFHSITKLRSLETTNRPEERIPS
jgi:hypothetical protein